MTQKLVPFSALALADNNPRHYADKASIKGLAASIKTDGLLQNLIVEKDGEGTYRVLGGKRRYLALKLLSKRGDIAKDYRVGVTIKTGLDGSTALRIATVENVQREALHPLDEAEAFSSLLEQGETLDDVVAQTGISKQTVRRRLALAALSPKAKACLRSGDISLSVAEALTVGSETQQEFVLQAMSEGSELDASGIRQTFLAEKPSVHMAIFPKERYQGSYTSDLFSDENSTYFDDVDEFMRLQDEAMLQKATRYEKKYDFVDVLHAYAPSWWRYREAAEDERGGVVMNLSPTGTFEVRKHLVRLIPETEDVTKTPEKPARKERGPHGPSLLRYAANHKSIAVQAELLRQSRVQKEVAVVLLLTAHSQGSQVRLAMHSCISAFDRGTRPRGYALLEEKVRNLLLTIGYSVPTESAASFWPLIGSEDMAKLYRAVKALSDQEIGELLALLPVLTFGQRELEQEAEQGSLFTCVLRDLGVSMREWWTPDKAYLSLLRREQLEQVALDSGASLGMARLLQYKKGELVDVLADYFARTSTLGEAPSEQERLAATWLPAVMQEPMVDGSESEA